MFLFFFSSRRRHTRFDCDWSSDVCSSDLIRAALWTLRGKRLAALGLAFKGGTDDVRDSPAVDLIRRLLDAGCCVAAHDPVAVEKAKSQLPAHPDLTFHTDPYEAAKSADALLILTEW